MWCFTNKYVAGPDQQRFRACFHLKGKVQENRKSTGEMMSVLCIYSHKPHSFY